MPPKYATAEERVAARRQSRKNYMSRPEVRAKERVRSRNNTRRKRGILPLEDPDELEDLDGEEIQEATERIENVQMAAMSPLPPPPVVDTAVEAQVQPADMADSVDLEVLVASLAERYKSIKTCSNSVTWLAYQNHEINADDLFWMSVEPTPEGMRLAERWHRPQMDADSLRVMHEHLTGRFARIESFKQDERTTEAELALTEGARHEILLRWRQDLIVLENKRQRLVRLELTNLPPSKHAVFARVSQEWAERSVLYLADAIITLERGRRIFVRTTVQLGHLGSRIIEEN